MAVNNRLNLGVPGITFEQMRTWVQANTEVIGHTHTFAAITDKPTTIAGYGITDFNSLGDARWSLLGHTHSFASLTAKPTTIGGYGITDFNALGDARWSLLGHTHAFSTLTGKPTTVAGYGITDPIVMGPASATNDALVRFDGTTGKLVQGSNALLTDAGLLGVSKAIIGAGSLIGTNILGVFGDVEIDGTLNVSTGLFLNGNTVGDVSGPAGAGDDAVPVFEGTTGKIIRSTSVSISSVGHLTAPSATVSGVSAFNGLMTATDIDAASLFIGVGTGDSSSVLDIIGDFAISGAIRTYKDSGELFGTVTPLTPPGDDIYVRVGDVSNEFYMGVGKATPDAAGFLRGTVGHAAVLHSSLVDLEIIRANTKRIGVTSAGVEVFGTLLLNGLTVGDVLAPNPATVADNAVPRWDGASSRTLQASSVTIDDIGHLTAPALTVTGVAIFEESKDFVTSVRIPHGVAPTSPVNGDFWSTTAGFYGRVNGTTVGPFIDSASLSGVTGPAGATDNAIARFNGATGNVIQNSSVTISDVGHVVAASMALSAGLEATGAILSHKDAGEIFGNTHTLLPPETEIFLRLTNAVNEAYIGIGNNTGSGTFTQNVVASALVLHSGSADIELIRDGVKRLGVTSAGVAVTGTLLVNGSPVGSGDVVGPAIANHNSLVRYDGSSGKLVKAGGSILTDAGDLTLAGELALGGALSGATTGAFSSNVTVGGTLNVTGVGTFGGFKFNNAAYLQWRNAANTLDLNVMRVTSTNNVEIEAPTGSGVQLRVNGTNILAASFSGVAITGALTAGAINGQTIGSAAAFSGTIEAADRIQGLYFQWVNSGFTAIAAANASGSYINAVGATNSLRILLNSAAQVTFAPTLNTFVQKAQFNGGVLVQGLAGSGTRPVGADASGNLVITTAGAGDVTGPGSATDNAIARYNLTTGKAIQNSSATISDAGQLNATSFAAGGSAGASGTVDTGAGTWELVFSGGLCIGITQLS